MSISFLVRAMLFERMCCVFRHGKQSELGLVWASGTWNDTDTDTGTTRGNLLCLNIGSQ